ncbi:MAG: DUF58 domain-containing protein [Desulfomonile tiedjei]|nr:DUF58 domain-containing protein [Desulfomonile tiedjei]
MRPTPYGWFLLFLLIWIPLAAVVTVNNFLFIIFTMMIGLAVVSRSWAKKNLNAVNVRRRLPHEIFAETPFSIQYFVKSDRKPYGSFSLSIREGGPLKGADSGVAANYVPAEGSAEVAGSFTIEARGDAVIEPGVLSSEFPFGLATYSRKCGPTQPVLVFPRIQPVEHEIPTWLGGIGTGLERPDPFGVVPYLFRDYVPGDRYKQIDWKKTARTGVLVSRVLSDEGAREITIRLPVGASENAVSRAASLVVHFVRSGRPVALEGPGFRTEPGCSHEHARKLLTVLARWNGAPYGEAAPSVSQGLAVDIDESGEFRWERAEDRHGRNQ